MKSKLNTALAAGACVLALNIWGSSARADNFEYNVNFSIVVMDVGGPVPIPVRWMK